MPTNPCNVSSLGNIRMAHLPSASAAAEGWLQCSSKTTEEHCFLHVAMHVVCLGHHHWVSYIHAMHSCACHYWLCNHYRSDRLEVDWGHTRLGSPHNTLHTDNIQKNFRRRRVPFSFKTGTAPAVNLDRVTLIFSPSTRCSRHTECKGDTPLWTKGREPLIIHI